MSESIWCNGKRGLCQESGLCGGCEHEDGTGSVELSESLLAYIRELEAKIPNWISVKDRLPEKGAPVLFVATSTRKVVSGTYVGEGKCGGHWFRSYKASQTGTHWMPRPEPPKGVV